MQAHGRLFLLSRVIATWLLFLRFVIDYAVGSWRYSALTNVLFVCLVSPLYAYPFFLQYWRIVHVFEYNKLKHIVIDDASYQHIRGKLLYLQYASQWYVLLCIFLLLSIPNTIIGMIGFVLVFTVDTAVPVYIVYTIVTYSIMIFIATFVLVVLSCIRRTKAPYQIYVTTTASFFFGIYLGISQLGSSLRGFIHQQTLLLFNGILFTYVPLIVYMIDVMTVVGVPIVQTFFYRQPNTTEARSSMQKELHSIIQDKDLVVSFEKFCMGEWSIENLKFYIQYHEWSQMEEENGE